MHGAPNQTALYLCWSVVQERPTDDHVEVATEEPAHVGEDERPVDSPSQLRSTILFGLLASLTTAIAAQVRLGYTFGLTDQAVLMVKGISLADPSAYVNDWFNDSSPQPHWSFDLLTALGEKIHALPVMYLLYYVAALVVFGIATALLARRWLPSHAQWLVALVGPLMVFGPLSPLGSTTPIVPMALPHVLGGCLAYLAIALILLDRPVGAAVATVLTAVVHVQHGANLAVIVILCAVVWTDPTKRQRIILATAGLVAGLHAVVATRLRGITGNGSDFIEVCQLRSPHHCDANSWAPARLTVGWILVVMIALLIWTRRRHEPRRLAITSALPLIGLLIGVWSDRLDVPVLGELAQSTNVYRLVTLVIPFAVWAILVACADADTTERRGPMALVATLMLLVWFSAHSAVAGTGSAAGIVMVLAIVTAAVITSGLWIHSRPNYPAIGSTAVLIAVLCSGLLPLWFPPFSVGYSATDPRVIGARHVQDSTPVGSVIVAPPMMTWLRAASRRAVVVDCKSVPYGGEPWRQYKERIDSLGGWGNCHGERPYEQLTLDDIAAMVGEYGASHMLVGETDPKYVDAADAGWELVDQFESWLSGDGFPLKTPQPAITMRLYRIGSVDSDEASGS